MYALLVELKSIYSGNPIQRMHAWLVEARRNGSDTPKPQGLAGEPLHQLLPTHLPACPVTGAMPHSGPARDAWMSRMSALAMTEWMIASYDFYDCGCPKSSKSLHKALGTYVTVSLTTKRARSDRCTRAWSRSAISSLPRTGIVAVRHSYKHFTPSPLLLPSLPLAQTFMILTSS